MDEVAIKLRDAGKALSIGPIQFLVIVELSPGQKFLPHKNHWNPGSCHDSGCTQRGALLGKPVIGSAGRDQLGDPLAAVSSGVSIMGFSEDDPFHSAVIEVLREG